MAKMRFGRYAFELNNADKVFFPDAGITKGNLVEYYRRIADTMLPHLRDRPISMQRFPDGIDGEGWYEKKLPGFFPDWVDSARVDLEQGGSQRQVVCNKAATLAYLAEKGCVTVHVWQSRTDMPRRPDRVVLDLDPPTDDFEPVRRAARLARDLLGQVGLKPFLMTTGSMGAHVVAPIERKWEFDRVAEFAGGIASLMTRRDKGLTTATSRSARRGRLFIDTSNNAYGQTTVAPYAVRAGSGAPVAIPLDWEELEDGDLHSRSYTMQNVFRRLGQKDDPWSGMLRHMRSIEEPGRRLAEMLRSEGDS